MSWHQRTNILVEAMMPWQDSRDTIKGVWNGLPAHSEQLPQLHFFLRQTSPAKWVKFLFWTRLMRSFDTFLVSPRFLLCLFCLYFLEVWLEVPGEKYKWKKIGFKAKLHTFPSPCPPHRWATGPWAEQSSASRSARLAGYGKPVRQGGPVRYNGSSELSKLVLLVFDNNQSRHKRNLRQPGKCLFHFGGLVHGIVVVETELVEPGGTEN